MVRADNDVHLPAETDARHRDLERAHPDAGRLDRQVLSSARCEEIQAHPPLRITHISHCDRVERSIQAPDGIAKEEIRVSLMIKGVAQIRALDLVARHGLAASGLMSLLVLVTKELFELDR
jgi:hypothetical protein